METPEENFAPGNYWKTGILNLCSWNFIFDLIFSKEICLESPLHIFGPVWVHLLLTDIVATFIDILHAMLVTMVSSFLTKLWFHTPGMSCYHDVFLDTRTIAESETNNSRLKTVMAVCLFEPNCSQ